MGFCSIALSRTNNIVRNIPLAHLALLQPGLGLLELGLCVGLPSSGYLSQLNEARGNGRNNGTQLIEGGGFVPFEAKRGFFGHDVEFVSSGTWSGSGNGIGGC